MKTQTFSIPLVAIVATVLFGHFAMDVAAQNSSTSTTTPNVTATASVSAGASIQLSSGVPEVLKLSRAQVNDDTIVAFVGSSRRTYNLSANEIVYLREQGVSDHVLTAMLDQRKQVTAVTVASTAPKPNNSVAANIQSAPTVAPSPITYARTAPVYVSPPPMYAYSAPTYAYYDSYPYYYGSSWGFPLPALSFNFGFGGGFRGGGFHGGGFHFGGGRHGGGFHGGGHHGGGHHGGGHHGGGRR